MFFEINTSVIKMTVEYTGPKEVNLTEKAFKKNCEAVAYHLSSHLASAKFPDLFNKIVEFRGDFFRKVSQVTVRKIEESKELEEKQEDIEGPKLDWDF